MQRRSSLLLAVLFATGAAAVVLAAGTALQGRAPTSSVAALSLDAAATATGLALLALAGAALSRAPLARRLRLGSGTLRLPTLVLLVVGVLTASHAIEAGIHLLGLREGGPLAGLDRVLAGARGTRLATALLAVGVAPGIGEELFFRGLVQFGLAPRFGAAVAIGVAAALFGAAHGDPVYAGAAFLLGIYLGVAAHTAGSVRTSAVCHIANNLAAVAEAAAPVRLPLPPFLSLGVGALVAIGALVVAGREAATRRPDAPASP